MATAAKYAEDATTGEFIVSTSIPSTNPIPQSKQRNACTTSTPPQTFPINPADIFPNGIVTELMSLKPPKRKRTPPAETPPSDPARATTFLGRDGLGAYIKAPESFPPSRVIYHNASFVVINDLFPKSSIHLLLLPRDARKQSLHPYEALEDPMFLIEVREEVSKVKTLAAKELRRRFGKFSTKDQAREAALEADMPEEQLPKGRDWGKEIVVGVHAVPSMNHLHIHILSRDRHSECLKHRKHYNSFATDFMVPVEDFPLDRGDRRRHPGREGFLGKSMKCWRCERDFGNKFQKLKEHLEEEFDMWRKE